jgi:putative acetyltransferase
MPADWREYRDDLSDLIAAWEGASAQAHPFLPPGFVAEVREAIPKLYLPNAETWVVEHEGAVVGFISLLGSEVGAIFVAPEHQGKGFGQELMNKARDLRGQLEVEVFSANSIGCGFYRSWGFIEMEEKIHEPTGLTLIRFQTTANKPE